MAANIEAGNVAYGQLKDQAAASRDLERQRLAKSMADMGVSAPQPLTVRNNWTMAGSRDLGDISRQNQYYTDAQNAMINQANANAAAQAAGVTAAMNAAENASMLDEKMQEFDRLYRMYMAKKITKNQFKLKTGMDVRGWAVRKRQAIDPNQDNGKQKPLIINNPYDYLNYEVQQGRMEPDKAAAIWNRHVGKENVNGSGGTVKEYKGKFDLQEYTYQQETGNLHSPGYYQGKAALWNQNADYYIDKYGKTEYNRYTDYYNLMAAQGKAGLHQSFTPYLNALSDMIENRPAYENKYGREGYNYLYNNYRNNAKGDIDKINTAAEWGKGGRFTSDIMEKYPWLKDLYVYDPNDNIDMMAQYLGYMPSDFNQEAANAYVDEAKRIIKQKAANDPNAAKDSITGLTPLDEIAPGNRPVTQEELIWALDVISEANMIGPYKGLDPSGNLSERGYSSTHSGGGQPIPRNEEQNKTLAVMLQSYGFIDEDVDIESLTPEELRTTADEGLEKYRDALAAYQNQQYQHSGASYLEPYKKVTYMTPEEIDQEIADTNAELEAAWNYDDSEMDEVKMAELNEWTARKQEYVKGLEMYRPTVVGKLATDKVKTVAENEALTKALKEQRDQLNKDDPNYKKQKGDLDIQIRVLEQSKPWVQQAEDELAIRENVISKDDFKETVEAAEKEFKQFSSSRHTAADAEKREDKWNFSEPYTGQAMQASTGIIGGFNTYYENPIHCYYTAEEKAVMNFFYYKGDKEMLKKYQDSLTHIVNERRTFSDQLFVQNTFRGDDESAKAGLIFNTFGEMLNSGWALGETGVNAITGQQTDPYSRFQQLAAKPQFVRNESLKYVPEGALKFLAETAYSGGDTLVAILCGPAAPFIMASEAGGQAANSIIQRGGSSGEAFLGGLATAMIEYFTERISIGKLFDTARTAGKFFTKETFIKMLQNAGINMSEEWNAETFGVLVDYAIMGDRSEIGMRMADLIESGVNPGEAMNQAFNEFLVYRPLEAAAGGALQGGLFSGGASVIGSVNTNMQQNVQQNRPAQAPVIEYKQQDMQSQNTGTVQLLSNKIDPNAAVIPKVQDSVINAAKEMQLRAEETQVNIYNDNVKNAYYRFRINPTNANAEAFYNTSIQNIETAIAAEQKAGADTSALAELKGRMESAKSVAAQAQPETGEQTARAAAERNMTKAVSALTNLPAGVEAKADAWAARQALYNYLKADEGGKAAAYSKTAEQLRKSVSAALEAKGLDKWTRQKLEGMLREIEADGGNSTGDVVKSSENKKNEGDDKPQGRLQMAGEVHPVSGVRFDMNGFPIFDVKTEVHLEQGDYLKSRSTHFAKASKALYVKILRNPSLASIFTETEIEIIKNGGIPNRFTWHHHQDPGRMQLVDRKIHRQTGHDGGYSIWGLGN